MAKKKTEEILTEENLDALQGIEKISEIESSFGNGDLNLLKEKINELVRLANR